MKRLYDNIWQTKLEMPFGGVHTHAYFLQCPDGNVLIYNTSHKDDIQHMNELGGIKYQYLSHRDEAGKSLISIREEFGSKLCCHLDEEPVIARSCQVDITFSERTSHFCGIEVIPTPGHTVGSVSFFYHSPGGQKYLFTGDTLFPSNGKWGTIVFPGAGGSTEALIDSLKIYRELDPDVVISSAFPGDSPIVKVTYDKWRVDIEDKIQELTK